MVDFIATKNLDSLTEEQRMQHYINVCEYLGLDPKAGLLRYEMMDDGSGTGTKHLVLYATKGATDRLRDIHGISVLEMTEKVHGGAVTYTAKGQNKAGRTDIAVGAATLEGVHGKKIGDAFMAAQTRASRRLTLQMAGTGLLDESEVTAYDGTVSLNDTKVPLAQIGQPVEVSNAPGVSIKVPATPETPQEAATATPQPVQAQPAAPIEEKRLPNPAAGLKPLPANAMNAPDGIKPPIASIVEKTEAEAIAAACFSPDPPFLVLPESPAPVEKTRRRRRTKAEMAEARAAEVIVNSVKNTQLDQVAGFGAIDPEVLAAGDRLTAAMIESSNKAIQQAIAESAPTPISEPVVSAQGDLVSANADIPTVSPNADMEKAPLVAGDLPNAEQMKSFVERLTVYRNDVLPNAGGMVPSNGMGVNKKIREFFMAACPGTTDLKNLTAQQWETVLGFMDDTLRKEGAKKLVEVIEFNIVHTEGEQA